MIVLMEQLNQFFPSHQGNPHSRHTVDGLRVVRGYFHLDREYYSDCYFKEIWDGTGVFAGGILYEVRNRKIYAHRVLMGHDARHIEGSGNFSFNDPRSAMPWITELSEQVAKAVDIKQFATQRRHPNPDCFYSLFPDPKYHHLTEAVFNHGSVKPTYRSLIEPTDVGTLFRGFLATNGTLCESASIADCIARDGWSWHNPISGYMGRLAMAYRVDRDYVRSGHNSPLPEVDAAINETTNIRIYVIRGRWISVEVLALSDKFNYYADALDIGPLLTYRPAEAFRDCEY